MLQRIKAHISEEIALHDVFGATSYQMLLEVMEDFKSSLKQQGIVAKRVLIKGENNRYFVALILSLLALDNEVILQEPQSTCSESKSTIDLYNINFEIAISEQQPIVLSHQNTNHQIEQAKLFFFSSGSTDIPKIFGFTLHQLHLFFDNWTDYIQLSKADLTLCPLSITHSHGTVLSFGALFVGSTLVFTKQSKLDVEELSELLSTYQPSILSGVPNIYRKLLHQLPKNFVGFRKLRYAFCGSAPMSAQLSQDFFDNHGKYINQAYGVSEIGPICADLQPELGLGTIGKVIQNIDYKIVDEDGAQVELNTIGELIVKADFMTDGYLNQSETTAATFKNGWLHTKDLVSEDELQRITIVGRKSSFINIAGFKVHPAEIEKCIANFQLDMEVAVKETIENGKTIIVAFLESEHNINLEKLKAHCQQQLAHYKIPTKFIQVAQLPKNSIGKVRYNQISKSTDDQFLPTI